MNSLNSSSDKIERVIEPVSWEEIPDNSLIDLNFFERVIVNFGVKVVSELPGYGYFIIINHDTNEHKLVKVKEHVKT